MLLYLTTASIFFAIIFFTGLSFLFVLKRFSGRQINSSFINVYFTGFVLLSVITSYVSIIAPINQYTTLVYGFLSVLGSIIFRKEVTSYVGNLKSLCKLDFIVIASVLILVTACSAVGLFIYDSGLYHVQAIKWIHEYPVVPGLGNLHGRFAFNSLFFPLSSAFSINNIFMNRELLLYPLNAITFSVFLIWEYFELKSRIKASDTKGIILTIIIVFSFLLYFLNWVSSPSPDPICAILTVFVLQWLLHPESKEKDGNILIVSLIFLSISYKLSTVFIFPIVFIFLSKKNWLRDISLVGAIGLIILLPFLLRNYYLSGYLIYPLPSLDIFDVDWKIPLKLVESEKLAIEYWAKGGFSFVKMPNLKLTDWIPTWITQTRFISVLYIINAFCFPVLVFVYYKRYTKRVLYITGILVFNLIYWFLNAPDPRFIYGILFFSNAYLVYTILDIIEFNTLSRNYKILLSSILIIGMGRFGSRLLSYYDSPIQLIIPKGFATSNKEAKKHSGEFTFYTPIKGDRCFNSDIPCMPELNNTLIKRGNDMGQGFQIKEKNSLNP